MSTAARTLTFHPATPRGVLLAECQDVLGNAETGVLLALKPLFRRRFGGDRPSRLNGRRSLISSYR